MVNQVAKLQATVEVDSNKAVAELKAFDSAMQRSASAATSATGGIASSIGKMESTFGSIAKSAAGFAAGQVGLAAATTAASGAFGATVVAAANYERQLNVMQAVSGATAAQIAQISTKAKELGNDLTLPGVSAAGAAAAMTELSKSGLTLNDTMSAAKGVLQLATAGQLSHADAAKITANALNAFSISGDRAGAVADRLAAAAIASSADVKELANGFSMASATFSSMQGPVVGAENAMTDLTTAMALLSNVGISGSDAGTALKQSLLQLAGPSDKAKNLMRELADNIGMSGDIAYTAEGGMRSFKDIISITAKATADMTAQQRDFAITTIFGADASRVIIPLMRTMGEEVQGTTKSWDGMVGAVTRNGAAADLAGAQMKGLAGTMAGLQSSMETIGLEIGQALLPGLAGIAQALSAGVSSSAFEALAGVITTMAGGVGTLAEGFLSLNNPISLATAATLGLYAAFKLVAANPVAVGLGIVSAAVAFMAGKFAEAQAAAQALNDKVLAAGASANTTYVTALRNIEAAGGGAAEKTAFLTTQVNLLTNAYSAGDAVLKTANEALSQAEQQYGKNSVQAQAASKSVDELKQGQINLYGSLQTAKGALDDNGASLLNAANTADAAKNKVAELTATTANAGPAAAGLDPLQQKLEELFNSSEKVSKALRDLVNPPTGREMAIVAQMAEVEGALKNLNAATVTGGAVRENYLAQSREFVRSSGLEGDALTEANRVLDQYEAGLISGAQAQKNMEAAVKPTTDMWKSQTDAMGATRDAIGKTAEAEIAAGRGWADSMEQRKANLGNFVDTALGRFPEIPAAAGTATTDTNTALSGIAGADVQGAVNSHAAILAGSIPPPITSAAEGAKSEANIILGSIGAGVVPDTAPVGAAAASGVLAGFLAQWAGVKSTITSEMEALAFQMSGALDARSPSRLIAEMVGEPIATGVAAGIEAKMSVATNAALGLTDAVVSAMRDSLQVRSPSKVFMRIGEYSADGFAIGLENGEGLIAARSAALGEAATAQISAAIADFNDWLDQGGVSAEWYADYITNLLSTFNQLGDGVQGVVAEDFSLVPAAFYEAGQAAQVLTRDWAAFGQSIVAGAPSLRQAQSDIAGIESEIALLQVALSRTEPYSAQRTRIEEQIKFLEGWKGQISSVITVQQMLERQLEASRTALDGFTIAQAKASQAAAIGAQTGKGGQAAGQAASALLGDNSAAAGATLQAEVEKIQTMLRERGIAGGTEFSTRLWEAAAIAARDRSPEAVSAVLGILGEINAAMPENARLGAQTWVTAYGAALADVTQQQALGSAGTALMASLADAIKTGGDQAIAAAAGNFVKVQQELQRLPEFVRGQLAVDMTTAMQAVMDAPGDRAALATLEAALGRANTALRVFPADIAKLRPEVQEAARRMFAGVEAGALTVQQAQERISEITRLIPNDFAEMSAATQAAIRTMVDGVVTGGIGIEVAVAGIKEATRIGAEAAKQLADEAQATLNRVKAEYAAAEAFFKKYGTNASQGLPGTMSLPQTITAGEQQFRKTPEGLFEVVTGNPNAALAAQAMSNGLVPGRDPGTWVQPFSPQAYPQAPSPPAPPPVTVNVTVQGNLTTEKELTENIKQAVSTDIAIQIEQQLAGV